MFAVGHFPILTNSLTLQIFCNIDLYTHINISSMNASSFVYIAVVIICTMMSFYQQILHSFSCYKVLCIGNLTYAGHFAVSPSTYFLQLQMKANMANLYSILAHSKWVLVSLGGPGGIWVGAYSTEQDVR